VSVDSHPIYPTGLPLRSAEAPQPLSADDCIKFFLTDGQRLSLLSHGGRCNLITVRRIQSMEIAMTNETLTIRFAQALLAVTATAASVLVVQFAMLVG
jgi:hypothetical protein